MILENFALMGVKIELPNYFYTNIEGTYIVELIIEKFIRLFISIREDMEKVQLSLIERVSFGVFDEELDH